MAKIIATTNVETLLDTHNGDPFAVLEAIDKQYKRGIITQHEAFLMIDVLTIYF